MPCSITSPVYRFSAVLALIPFGLCLFELLLFFQVFLRLLNVFINRLLIFERVLHLFVSRFLGGAGAALAAALRSVLLFHHFPFGEKKNPANAGFLSTFV